MTYTPPTSPNAVDFNLTEAPYIIPGATAVDFDLAGTDPGIVYPIPPGIMVTSTLSVTLTSSAPVGSAGVGYSMTPAQKQVRQVLSAPDASRNFNQRAPGQWDKVPVKDEPTPEGVQPWGTAAKLEPRATGSGWDRVPVKDESRGGPSQAWDSSIRPLDGRAGQGYNVPPLKDETDRHPHADIAKYWERPPEQKNAGYIPTTDFNLSASPYTVPAASTVDFDLQPPSAVVEIVVPTRPLFSGRDLQGWATNKPQDHRERHPWDDKPRKGTEVDFDYDQDPPLPDKPPAPDPEIKEGYFFMNSSSLKKLPEGIPLDFEDLNIDLDIDSFSWALSVRILNPESMDQIRPGPAGPVEVEATVNNKTWRFMVERYSREQKFPRETYRVNGSSLTQLLAHPYSPKESAQIETPTNALQVAQDVLELTGFSIVWDPSLPDYTIPAGAWGYESKSPIEVIDELVKAAGGILVPTLSLSEIRAYHRYREGAPWYWDQVDPARLDFQIADSTILGLSSQWEPNPDYNGVYVSGISDGVSVVNTKFGTAGDVPAPDDYHALNLTTQQCRGKAISILGQGGNQEIMTLEIPIPTSGAPGLVIPGQWGEVQDTRTPENSWRALNLSTSVKVAKPGSGRAVQILKLERHHY
ncbi:MAG: hypothetical protein HLX50_09095 [Alteromonadaceae bacterium]|nr:hypothetical protein [Alteromonadaceae bacterium]